MMRRLVLASVLIMRLRFGRRAGSRRFPLWSQPCLRRLSATASGSAPTRSAFQQHGDKRTVTTSIDFAVKALGLTVYRYSHRGQEVWNGDRFAVDRHQDRRQRQASTR